MQVLLYSTRHEESKWEISENLKGVGFRLVAGHVLAGGGCLGRSSVHWTPVGQSATMRQGVMVRIHVISGSTHPQVDFFWTGSRRFKPHHGRVAYQLVFLVLSLVGGEVTS
jgi:hypothetical protein